MLQRSKGETEHNDVSRQNHTRAHGPLARAICLARRAIVAAKLRRLRGELICHASGSIEPYAKPVADAGRWPQAPLILGDKWDF